MTSLVEKNSPVAIFYRATKFMLGPALGLALASAALAQPGNLATAGAQSSATVIAMSPQADNGAVAVMYQRFGEGGSTATNITLEQFDRHLAELTSGTYKVLPLAEIIGALREDRSLPDRSVAITLDDAYLSVYRKAWPRLKAANLPFTLFVSTDTIDRGYADFMNWDQLRELAADPNVSIGLHGGKHGHMIEDDAATNRLAIERSARRLQDELGLKARFFAYPFGEYSATLVKLAREAGFEAAFGQHSGAIARTEDLFALPRFPLSEAYGSLDRFRLTVNSLPLPVTDVTPGDLLLTPATNPPAYGFTVSPEVGSLNGLQCYTGNHEIMVETLGVNRVEIRIDGALEPGRRRINCTLPGPDRRWRWLGRQFYVPPT